MDPGQSPISHSSSLADILVVAHDDALRGLLSEMLSTRGYRVTVASNGAEALPLIVESDFNAVLTDYMMPMMKGDVLYTAVMRLKPYLGPRFLFMTVRSNEESFRRTREDGIDFRHLPVLLQPFVEQDLFDALCRAASEGKPRTP